MQYVVAAPTNLWYSPFLIIAGHFRAGTYKGNANDAPSLNLVETIAGHSGHTI